ncbi:MAG: hypothetical protein ACRETC_12510, partial [Gammaproteobacteria bacterium]
FNVAMDLEPFSRINPCGYAGLEMTQVSELGGPIALDAVADAFLPHLLGCIAPVAFPSFRRDPADTSGSTRNVV